MTRYAPIRDRLDASFGQVRRPPVHCGQCSNQACRGLFGAVPPSARGRVNALRLARQSVAARSALHLQGDEVATVAMLYDGWAVTHRTLRDGRRHVTNVLMPGDFVRLPLLAGRAMSYGCEAITEVTACLFDIEELLREAARDRALRHAIARMREREHDAALAWQTSLACRTAEERVAYIVLEVFRRARAAGLAVGNSCAFPVPQAILAEATGLSLGNVNRIVGAFRRDRLLHLVRRRLSVLDEAALARRAAFGEDDGFQIPAAPARRPALEEAR